MKEEDKIQVNAIACNNCGEIIYSKHRHDFRWCGCNSVAIDGGFDYTRINVTGDSDGYVWMSFGVSKEDFLNYKKS